jgi:hypothetical protein
VPSPFSDHWFIHSLRRAPPAFLVVPSTSPLELRLNDSGRARHSNAPAPAPFPSGLYSSIACLHIPRDTDIRTKTSRILARGCLTRGSRTGKALSALLGSASKCRPSLRFDIVGVNVSLELLLVIVWSSAALLASGTAACRPEATNAETGSVRRMGTLQK